MLKPILSILLLLGALIAQAQSFPGHLHEANFKAWSYNDFMKAGVTYVEAVRYKYSHKAKLTDSLLLYSKTLNKEQRAVAGVRTRPGNVIRENIVQHFVGVYDEEGRLVKDSSWKTKKGIETADYISYDISHTITTYQYDEAHRLLYERQQDIDDAYVVDKSDTLLIRISKGKMNEYVYTAAGKLSATYFTQDSIESLTIKKGGLTQTEKECMGCKQRYMNNIWQYDDEKKLNIETTLASNGKVHDRHYYYYDNNDSLVNRVDSTGWFWEDTIYLFRKVTYEYNDTGKVKLEEFYARSGPGSSRRTVFDKMGNILLQCLLSGGETCNVYQYVYKNGKVIEEKHTDNNGFITVTIYRYNSLNLPEEVQVLTDGKLREVIKYSYR